jgi:dUTP pyrophosphatase
MTELIEQSNVLLQIYGKYMHLKLFVDSEDSELLNKYKNNVETHNSKILSSSSHIDAGFDLFAPEVQIFMNDKVNKLDTKVSCSAEMISRDIFNPLNVRMVHTGYCMYPRSSISKSHIRLANNVGIIDAGYRGHLMGMFDVIYKDTSTINKYDRYLQICAPDLCPILITMVETKEDLGEKTIRGDGGFGSTGL